MDIIRAPPERHPPLAEGHVKSLIGQLGPLLGNKLNVVYDLTVVMIAAVAAARLAGRNVDPQLLACAGCLALCWSVESFVVRYYDRWANRSGVEEIALVCLLAVGLAVTLGTMHFVVPRPNSLPGITPYLLLLCPSVLGPRLLISRKLVLDILPPPHIFTMRIRKNFIGGFDFPHMLLQGSKPLAYFTGRDAPKTGFVVSGMVSIEDDVI